MPRVILPMHIGIWNFEFEECVQTGVVRPSNVSINESPNDPESFVDCGKYDIVVDLRFPSRETVVMRKIEALRDRKKRVQADLQARVNKIDDEIQSLLALPAPPSIPAESPTEEPDDDIPF